MQASTKQSIHSVDRLKTDETHLFFYSETRRMIRFILMVSFLTTISSYLFGQKKFEINLSFPQTLDLTKLNIQVDNGFGRSSVPFKVVKNNQATLSGVYYSKYVAIVLNYPQKENWNYRNFFFVGEKPARIRFLPAAKDLSPFDNYSLINAYDFKAERDSMDASVVTETTDAKNYYEKFGSLLFDGKHKDLEDHYFELDQNIYKKIIDYIKNSDKSYFSFWYFRSNARYSGLPSDSLLSIFESIFPDNFKKSIEGNAFTQLLIGTLASKKGSPAPQFSSKDIMGNSISLSSFKNKKYVLLDFWATWCGPCIKKMPLLSDLHEKFSQDLEIISIAYPTSLAETKQVIAKQKITWTNVYDDRRLINSFGGMGAIPRLFLIDKSGKIIYDNQEDNDEDLEKLITILTHSIAAK